MLGRGRSSLSLWLCIGSYTNGFFYGYIILDAVVEG